MKRVNKEIINYLRSSIRNVPDFPKKGIQFKDITSLLQKRDALAFTADMLVRPFIDLDVDHVLGIESRGFMFGPVMAIDLNAGFIPVRKPGKLPADTIEAEYELEYGTDKLQLHKDAIQQGERVIIHDDLLATGGTAKAATKLVEELGGTVVGYSFVIELDFLKGRDNLNAKYDVHSIVRMSD